MARTITASTNIPISTGTVRTVTFTTLATNTKAFQFSINGTTWPAGVELLLEIYQSFDNGTTWRLNHSGRPRTDTLDNGFCSIGLVFEPTMGSRQLRIRVEQLAGPATTLVPTLIVDD